MSGHDGKQSLTSPINLENRGTQRGEGMKAWTLWLSAIIKFGGSDLIVKSDLKPRIRHRGVLKDIETDVVTMDLMFQIAKDVLDAGQQDAFSKKGSMDFAYDYDDKNRFRVNMFMARGRPSIAARLITSNIKKFEDLYLPQALGDVALQSQGLILFAGVLVAKRNLFVSAGTHFLGMDLPRPRDLAPLLGAWIISVGVMVFEKDLGTSLLLYASFLVMVYVATERFSWVAIGLALFGAGSVVAYHLFGHVRGRVQTWIDPFADPEGAGYQMVQSKFSFATGGVFGTGLGNGQPGTVPAASTDFIISVVGEELGLVGLAGVLLLYTIVIVRGLRTAIAVRDSFGKLLAAGLASTLAIQLFIVVGGVTGLIPLTGLTTPWMSYGGSSLVANYILLAILVRISHAARRPISTATPIAAARTEVIGRT